ncbi:hypothetical protein KUCAC02_025686 [Chaenocephalus aceratus]|uniref:Uncharacterized protein n=1 Tax=Chaenocephalus aceratus TaxID=36190 RepID=A0ACB9VVR8_CHAAC|nr:hypothetical protein KUCAC02_025686 [Chaenocephalus aceratus]
MGKKTKKSDNNDSDGRGEEGCELASHASNNSAHGEVYPSEVRVPRPTTFIESFLAEIFGPDCLHHFQMKQRIMQLAREKGPLMYRGAEIHICGLQCRSSQEESRIYPHQVHAEKRRARFQPPLPC